MTISGQIPARCRECNCRIAWHVDSMPSSDAEFLFTCDNCMEKRSHDCYDEFTLENDTFAKVGRKEFT